MHELTDGDSGILDLLHSAGGAGSVPEPFSREIFLCQSCVWDLDRKESPAKLFPFLKIGDKVSLFPEAEHPLDTNAVRVENEDGVKLGYIYPRHSMLVSNLLKAGKRLPGYVIYKGSEDEWNGDPWRGIIVEISLRD